MRRGGRSWFRTAEAATASGGATIAPSAIAAAIGRSAIAQPTNATAAVVNPTATSTSDASG